MASRIATSSITDAFIRQLYRQRIDLQNVQNELTTGQKVTKPSDAPGVAGTVANFQLLEQRIEGHKNRISYATAFLSQQDQVLSSVQGIMLRAKEIATQAVNETYSAAQRAQISAEIFQLRDQLVSLANTTFQGKYIYGGADDDDPPFDATNYTESPTVVTDPAYVRYVFDGEVGTDMTRSVEVSDDTSMIVNTAADTLFERAIAGLERLGRSMAGHRTTVDVNGIPTGLGVAYTQPADYTQQTIDIRGAMDFIQKSLEEDIIPEQTSIGARLNRLDTIGQVLDSLKYQSETHRSKIQDADIFESSSRFTQLQTALQALMQTGARVNNLSLLDFL
jgi:flagellar hook-associated protein 3 FlgL